MIRLLLAFILTTPAIAGAATIAGRDLAGQNLICGPGSTADNSIPCSPSDVLSGVFTNVGLFQVNAGTTVFVTPATPLVVFASTISIPGLLNGSGRGEVGGIGGDPGQPGGDGDGRGPGIGAFTNMGGGGGAYGGDGGNGAGSIAILGSGGASYDDIALPITTGSISPGSGGGGGGGSGTQTGGSGGQGGASIYLEASSFTLTGTIFVRGVPGGNSTRPADAGGGGAGGGLLLRCMDFAAVGGVINANGGKGGDAAGGSGDTAYPGGGGGGGRVKIYYRQAAFSVAISTAGGAKGIKSGSGGEGLPKAQDGSIGAVSFSIVASSPTNLAFPAVFATSITWSWTAAPDWGNAAEASRKYRLYSGTVSYRTQDRLPQLVASSDTLSATEAGLLPNTAYTRYITAFTDHSDSLPSDPVSTYTLAGLPGAAASTFTAVAPYSLSLNWSAGEPANPGYTTYEVNRSTAIDFGVAVSTSFTTALSSAPAGLTPNTTYYFRVRAINMAGLPTGFTSILSTATLAAEPADPLLAGVSSTGFNFSWNGGGNPPQTRYIAEISTDNFATLSRSSSTFNTGAAFTGLAVNTLYYARAKAQNHNGLDTAFTTAVTTVTTTAPPLNAPAPFTNLSDNSLTFNWESGGNGAGTNYNPEISTSSGFSAPVSSAVTTNLNFIFTGLSVNTTYYARVRALGAGGLASLYSSPAVSTATLTLSPVTASPPFTGVFAGSFTFSWENGGNPGGTLYAAEISKDGFVSVSSAVRTSALSVNFSALEANTVYQARVRAINFSGIPGQYSSPIVSTATAISAAVNAAAPFPSLSAAGLTFSWSDGGNSAGTSYNPEISTSSNFSAPVSSNVTTNLNYVFTGLSVNTTYYAHVRAIGVGGNLTAYTGAVSTVTYALAPLIPSSPYTVISTTGFTLSWSDGGNPLNTRYAAEISRNNFDTLIASASTLSTSAAFSGLIPNTVYQARIRAINFLGVDGPYSSPIRSTATLVTDPLNSAQPFTAVSASTATFTWADGGNPGGTSYTVELSSSAFAPGTAISSASTLALSQTFSGLLPNTTYYGRARAVNMDNVPGGYSPAFPAVTLPLPPALAAAPFSGVTSSGLTFSWTGNGNPQDTSYVAELSGNGFVSVSSAVQTSALSVNFSALSANTVYQARVRAINFAGVPGGYSSPIVSTATASSLPVNVAAPFLNLSAGGLTFNWESGGNSAGTNYNPEISTSSSFSAPVSSEVTTNLNYIFTGLSVNATYYAHVRAIGVGGDPTAYTGAVSTVTYTLAPLVAAAPFTGVSTTGFTLSWSDGGNPPGTLYAAEISKDGFATLVASASTISSSAVFSGLTPNTVYQARARAHNFLGVDGPYSGPVRSTATLATDPVNAAQPFTAVSAATVTFNWTDGVNPGGTRYIVELSSAGFAPGTAISSAATLALSQTFSGLLPNTTYYGRAKAVNADEIPSGYSPAAGAVTLPLSPAPAVPPFSGVTSAGITFSWTANGNPQNTVYVAELSGNGFVSVSSAVQTTSLSAAFSALTANTVYQARVRAVNFAGIPGQYSSPIVSTATAGSEPGNAAVPFPNVSAAGLTFAWGDGGNPPGTNYNAEISTNSSFSAPVSSAVTTNLNYVFTGLSVNATYYARARTLGSGGLTSLYSSPVVSTVTLTVSPVTAAPPFTGVFAGSFTFSWENGGNPGGTLYTAEISKDGFVSVSSAALTSALSAVFSALTANTVYQARVRAVNFAGIPGLYSSPIVSTATAGSVPVNTAAPFLNLSAGGLTFAWGDGGNAAGTSYNLELSTSSGFSAPVSSDVTTNLNYVFTGLSANTTYYTHVRAVGAGGNYTAYTGAVSTVTYTLAPVITAAPFTGISTAGFTLSWNDGGNPLNTRYAAEISRNNFDTILASAATLATSAAFAGFTPNTVYQARVKAINFLGVDGPYSSPIRSTATLVTAPLNADQPFTAVSASTLTFTWADGGNPGGTSYTVELSSAGFAPGTAISSAATLALSQTFGGLLPNTTYYGRARAVNMDNVPGGYSAVVTEVTLPLSPALAAAPFSGVTSSGLTFSWTANGNPQNTTYVAEISKDNFVSVSLSSTTLNIPAAFTGLTPNTTYTARVRAVNFSGSAGPYASPVVSTATLAVPPQSAVSSFTLTDGGLTVSWSAGDNPSGTMYETEVSTRPDFTTLWASAAAAGVSGNFALAANTTYYARVRARNYNGVPTADLQLGGELTYAAPPAASASVATGAVNVTTFSFINTVSTGTGGLLFYRTVWDRNATHVWNDQEPAWDALAVVTATATGNGYWFLHLRSYNFKALGYKTADVGPFHVALSTVIPPGQPVPVPGAFTATSGITWNWPPALAFGDTVISTYVVSVGTTPADFNVLVDSEIGPLASFTLDPAANGKTYYLKVKAIDEGGILSQYSPVSSPGVLVDRTAPDRLGAVRADREYSYDSTALFSWSATEDQESGVKAYLLDLGTTLNGNDIFSAKNMGLALSSLETGLPSGKSVFARVRAENNAGGVSDYSDPGPGIPVWSLGQVSPMVQPYNWPNPFDPMAGPTQIGFYLKAPAKVTLKLFTLEGDLVYEENRGESSAGNKVWPWAGRNGAGKITAPGGYICIIEKKYAGKTERQKFKLAVLY